MTLYHPDCVTGPQIRIGQRAVRPHAGDDHTPPDYLLGQAEADSDESRGDQQSQNHRRSGAIEVARNEIENKEEQQ
jgi:hypothetical protein